MDWHIGGSTCDCKDSDTSSTRGEARTATTEREPRTWRRVHEGKSKEKDGLAPRPAVARQPLVSQCSRPLREGSYQGQGLLAAGRRKPCL